MFAVLHKIVRWPRAQRSQHLITQQVGVDDHQENRLVSSMAERAPCSFA
jgi:hypothetical protein